MTGAIHPPAGAGLSVTVGDGDTVTDGDGLGEWLGDGETDALGTTDGGTPGVAGTAGMTGTGTTAGEGVAVTGGRTVPPHTEQPEPGLPLTIAAAGLRAATSGWDCCTRRQDAYAARCQ